MTLPLVWSETVPQRAASMAVVLLTLRQLPSLDLPCPNKYDNAATTTKPTSLPLCVHLLLQALVYYTESLKSTDVQIQQGSCLALKCLRVSSTYEQRSQKYTFHHRVVRYQLFSVCVCVYQATESVDLIADLWRSSDEDLRNAAKETVLSFGTNMNYSSLICVLLYDILLNFILSICR